MVVSKIMLTFAAELIINRADNGTQNNNNMDVQLLQNAPALIEKVQEAFNYWGEDISRDPWNTVLNGVWSQSAVDSFLDDMKEEINAVIDFASKWDIDASEWDFSTIEKQFEFAVSYLSIDMESEKEYQQEQEQEKKAA